MGERRGPWAFIQAFVFGGGLVAIWSMPQWQWQGDVRIHGSQRSEVLSLAEGTSSARPLFLLDPAPWREKLEGDPAIAEVRVHRWLFPTRLEVTVQERTPVARVVDAPGTSYMDREGVVFPLGGAAPVTWSVRLAGRTLSASERSAWRSLQAAWPKAPHGEVDLRDPASWSVRLEGVTLMLGAPRDLAAKLRVYGHVRPLARQAGKTLEYIDLRFPEAPTVRASEATR